MAAVAMVEATEIRIARLESDVAHIRSDVADLKVDVREMRKEIGGIHEKIGGLGDEMRKKFKTVEHSNLQTRIWMLLIGGAILGVLAHEVHWL